MFSPTMMSKVNELTKNSSVAASLLIAEQENYFGLHLLIISPRYDAGMMYKELGKFDDKATCEAAAFAVLNAIEVYEECQLLIVEL
ncbi:MAG: hypothetical protein ACO3OJ_09665 [Paracoccaceae bacterium]|jgi:hypothetical protein